MEKGKEANDGPRQDRPAKTTIVQSWTVPVYSPVIVLSWTVPVYSVLGPRLLALETAFDSIELLEPGKRNEVRAQDQQIAGNGRAIA
jgi:hypothetical protein